MNEIWKDVVGFEGYYRVSNKGRIMSLYKKNHGKILKCNSVNNSGYTMLNLHMNKKLVHKTVHRLVAEAFIPNPNNYPEVNHIDQNKFNNNVDNLEWCTHKQNVNHGDEIERGALKQRRHFKQLDMEGDLIKIWHGFKKMQREFGYDRKAISECCSGKRDSYGGYRWEYVQEES